MPTDWGFQKVLHSGRKLLSSIFLERSSNCVSIEKHPVIVVGQGLIFGQAVDLKYMSNNIFKVYEDNALIFGSGLLMQDSC